MTKVTGRSMILSQKVINDNLWSELLYLHVIWITIFHFAKNGTEHRISQAHAAIHIKSMLLKFYVQPLTWSIQFKILIYWMYALSFWLMPHFLSFIFRKKCLIGTLIDIIYYPNSVLDTESYRFIFKLMMPHESHRTCSLRNWDFADSTVPYHSGSSDREWFCRLGQYSWCFKGNGERQVQNIQRAVWGDSSEAISVDSSW